MKGCQRVIVRFLIILLVLGILFASWVSYPPSRYEPQLQVVLERHRQKLLSQQKIANDPAQNAYLHPQLRPYWGGQEGQKPGKMEDFSGWFHEAMKKPYFVVPQGQPLHLEAWAGIDEALPGYANSLPGKGQTDEALSVGDDLLRWGSIPGVLQNSLDSLRLALRSRTCAQETVARLLQTAGLQAGRPQLESLAKTLEQTQFPAESLVAALEGVLANEVESYRPAGLPGLPQRELRLLKNDSMICLEEVRAGQLRQSPPYARYDWLLGRHSEAWNSLRDQESYQDQLELSARRQAFLHLVVQLLIYHQKNGQWPVDLEEIQGEGFHPLAGLNIKQVQYDALGVNLEVSVEGQAMSGGAGPEPPNLLDKPKWVFRQPDGGSMRP